MSTPPLVEIHPDGVQECAKAEPLIMLHTLAGFVDAGSATSMVVKHLRESCTPVPVASFAADVLIDYRARRPRMRFENDRFTRVDLPEISLELLTDTGGRAYLLLHGLEPDVMWQAFVRDVVRVTEQAGVRLAIGLQAVPWAAPHTRPVGLTPYASDRSLIAGRPRWVDEVDIPGSADSLIHMRLAQAGVSACGFAAHVPQYLSAHDFPSAAVALLDAVSQTSDLVFDTDRLREQAAKTLAELDEQVQGSPETLAAVAEMESDYDAVVAGENTEAGMFTPHLPDDELVGEDRLAADFEDYLRKLGDEPEEK